MAYIDTNSILWKEKDGMVTVMKLADGAFFELNTLGSRVWKLLADGKTPQAIVDTLAPLYSVSQKTLAADVDAFITQMALQGLLVKPA